MQKYRLIDWKKGNHIATVALPSKPNKHENIKILDPFTMEEGHYIVQGTTFTAVDLKDLTPKQEQGLTSDLGTTWDYPDVYVSQITYPLNSKSYTCPAIRTGREASL